MQAVTGTLGTLFTFQVKDQQFRADYVASLLFNVALVLELIFMAEINFGDMNCIPSFSNIDAMINGTKKGEVPAYVNLVCATEIRWQRMLY